MKKNLGYRLLFGISLLFFPKVKTKTKSSLPTEPCVFVCNHATARGPVWMSRDFTRKHKTWILNYALEKEKCPKYAFHDIFFGETRKHKKWYRFLSKLISHLLPPLLRQFDPIPVYHDKRLVKTLTESVEALTEGYDLVIFAESPARFSQFVNNLNDGFVAVGRSYFRSTGQKLKFFPVYAEQKNRVISVGEEISYNPDLSLAENRELIGTTLRDGIDSLARSLPKHKPVPFLEPRWYTAYGQYEFNPEAYFKMMGE